MRTAKQPGIALILVLLAACASTQALGYVDEFAPGFTPGATWYVLDLVPGGLCDGANQGRALHAGTTRDAPGDYAENRRVLDAMVRSIDIRGG